MICKILTDKKSEYASIVLALINPGWKIQALVLNENKTEIIKVPIYETFPNIKRKVFIIDSETKGWEKSQVKIKTKLLKRKVEVEGYDWAIKKLSNMEFNLDDVKKAKELDEKAMISEWNYVCNEKDVEDLKSAAWDFHDSSIELFNYQHKSRSLTVLFEGCWSSKIELIFENIETAHFYSNDNLVEEIYSSSIFFNDGFVYWIDENIDSLENITDKMSYFKARSLKWKIIIEK